MADGNGRSLYLPLGGQWKQQAVKSRGTYRLVEHLNILVVTDVDRKALGAAIGLPDVMARWQTQDVGVLKGVISKLQEICDQMQARGQSKIVNLAQRKDWEEERED